MEIIYNMIETKESMKQFTEAFKRRGKEYEKQEIKLKRTNKRKYCVTCKKVVEINMKGLNGYCPYCSEKLYTMNARKERGNQPSLKEKKDNE